MPTSKQQWDEPFAEGLYVDVDFVSPWSGKSSVIRVYPFVMDVEDTFELELKGTEHDECQWIGLDELETLDEEDKTVPSLALAFHHATAGRFDNIVTKEERQWASDKENGASTMSRNALKLIMESGTADPARLAMLRPSMVTIVNCMMEVQRIITKQQFTRKRGVQQVLDALDRETKRTVQYAVDILLKVHQEHTPPKPLVLATFSRSSTLVSIIQTVLEEHREIVQFPILCSKSVPGGEGQMMARDLCYVDGTRITTSSNMTNAICVEDDLLMAQIRENKVDVLLLGADCVLSNYSSVSNKVGTTELASAANASSCKVLCCTDRLKVWDDIFPPPMEKDLFEMVPVKDHINHLLVTGTI
jgi:translation initiation factor 2B subunit (eIF-2B alpha/beta/delta family)